MLCCVAAEDLSIFCSSQGASLHGFQDVVDILRMRTEGGEAGNNPDHLTDGDSDQEKEEDAVKRRESHSDFLSGTGGRPQCLCQSEAVGSKIRM